MKSYGIIKQRANHISHKEYQILKNLSYASKNLYNKALYIKRQDFFKTKVIRKSIDRSKLPADTKKALLKRKDVNLLTYNELYHMMKNEPEYRVLNCNMSQQILKLVDRSFKLPPILKDKTVKEIRIIPKQNARFFEVQYVYEKEISNGTYNKNNALAIDLGINNLMTCVANDGKSFIIDGKRIKSVNQYANKENARLQSIADKQNDIGNIVLGFNKDMTRNVSLGKKTIKR